MKSQQGLYEAAIESARIFNHAVREVADSSGLLTVLTEWRTVEDCVRLMNFLPSRRAQVEHLLRVLVTEGAAEERFAFGRSLFRAAPATGLSQPARYAPKYDRVDSWFGEGHAELIRQGNKHLLGRELDFLRSDSAAIRFNCEYELGWRTNLQNPLYDFGRLMLVRELVARGSQFLDLACGPGFGAMRLAEFSDGPCEITCVDKSRDFLDIARTNLYPQGRVTFVERDLNTGLPPVVPGSLDGILFNGAFHFMQDKPARLREIHRALRPGGVLALGHCFSYSSFDDESMHNFYFSLLEDRAYVLPWNSVKELITAAGFALLTEFHRGSHSYLLAERTPDPPVAFGDDALRGVGSVGLGGALGDAP